MSEIKKVESVIVCKDDACPAIFTGDGPFHAGMILPCGHEIKGVFFSALAIKEAPEEK